MFFSHGRQDRRSFLTRFTGFSAIAMLTPSQLAFADPGTPAAPWDLSWLDSLNGKHKQVFDHGSVDLSKRDILAGDSPLRVPRNYMNAHKEVYGLESPQVNTIVAISYDALPMNVNDDMWRKYSLGEKWQIKDSSTGTWAVRNLFSALGPAYTDSLFSLEALRKRGTIFWQCNNALGGAAAVIGRAMNIDPARVRADLIANFVPGVKLVPAHTMALGLAQERGFTYEKV